MKRADPSTHISVIETSQLDPRAIFHVAPFYAELKKKRPFYRGGFNYTGTSTVNQPMSAEAITFAKRLSGNHEQYAYRYPEHLALLGRG